MIFVNFRPYSVMPVSNPMGRLERGSRWVWNVISWLGGKERMRQDVPVRECTFQKQIVAPI